MKNIGGRYFDEAYFILKNDSPHSPLTAVLSSDLSREAETIVRSAMNKNATKTKKSQIITRLIAFALGAATSSALIGLFALILALS